MAAGAGSGRVKNAEQTVSNAGTTPVQLSSAGTSANSSSQGVRAGSCVKAYISHRVNNRYEDRAVLCSTVQQRRFGRAGTTYKGDEPHADHLTGAQVADGKSCIHQLSALAAQYFHIVTCGPCYLIPHK